MKTAHLLLAALLACTPVQAAVGSAPVSAQTPTPFFRGEGYPSWSQMTPASAVSATQAAIMESEQRLAAIAALQPAEYTFENTFLACYKADENLRQVQGYLYHLSNVVASPAWQQALGRMQRIIARTMELRHKLATLLGYRHYADMMAADRMMGNAERALAFVDDLLARSKPAWDAYVAEKLTRHYATGAPLPRHLAELLAADRRRSPIAPHMQLLCAAKLDLELNMYWHEKFRGRPLDVAAAELLAPWQMPYTCPVPCTMRTMQHCMSEGYAAALYTYKWCEVMAADVHARFRQEGILNPATGAGLRRTILEKGGSRPASDLFRDYMGRDPQPDALMRLYQPTTL